MEVILLEKIRHLGALGDKVRVKPGFARNYLIPNGKATMATPGNIAAFEARRADLEKAQADSLAAAEARAAALSGRVVTIARKAGDEGRLFGSVGVRDIADALSESGEAVDKGEVRLPEGPLRDVGDHEVSVHLHADVDATVTVSIVAE